MKKVVFIADNLEGGAARLAEDILLEWLMLADRPPALLIQAGSIELPEDPRLEKVIVRRKGFIAAHFARCLLVRRQEKGSLIYNFTNFPIPNIFCRGKNQITLLHNAYLITFPKKIYGHYPLSLKAREFLKRLAFHLLLAMSNKSKIVVQSNWMKGLFQKSLGHNLFFWGGGVTVLPRHRTKAEEEYSISGEGSIRPSMPESFWFYPAALYPHKNHDFVLEVAARLKEQGSSLRIVITIDVTSSEGESFWGRVIARKLDEVIVNTQWISPQQVRCYLTASKGLFFPSTFESLGLPLLEALDADKPIIAAATELNAEITQGAAYLFEIDDENAAANVVQAMLNASLMRRKAPETLSKSSLIETYVLSQVGQL